MSDVKLSHTSCPNDINVLFSNAHITLDDIQRVVDNESIFPDIIRVTCRPDVTHQVMIMSIHFIDDSIQRVEVPESEFYTAKKIGRSRPDSFTVVKTPQLTVTATNLRIK